jgi:hypothetical protein
MPARKPSSARSPKTGKAEATPTAGSRKKPARVVPTTGAAPAGETAGEPIAPDGPPATGRAGTVADRRLGLDRRLAEADDTPTGLERRRSAGRRLSDFTRSAEEGELTQEQFLFIMAIDAFKKANNTSFPTWTDVLEIVRLLGYRKTMPSEITLRAAEDWREPPVAPSGVRTERQMMRDRDAREAAIRRAERDAA